MIKSSKIVERYLRTFIIKILFFILPNLLSIRDLVDTQQLPIYNYTISESIKQANKLILLQKIALLKAIFILYIFNFLVFQNLLLYGQ